MSIQNIRPIRHRTLHQSLVEQLRDLIVSGGLPPGEKVNEKLLCERFGVSRTPLREAMKSLAAEGLVRITPRRGVRVTEITLDDLAEVFPLLGAMESLAGEMACARVTESAVRLLRGWQARMVESHAKGDLETYFRLNQKLHATIAELSGNETLQSMREMLDRRVRRARYMANLSPARWSAAVREHEGIINALEARDGPRLGMLLRAHLSNKHAALIEALEEAEAAS